MVDCPTSHCAELAQAGITRSTARASWEPPPAQAHRVQMTRAPYFSRGARVIELTRAGGQSLNSDPLQGTVSESAPSS
jgi:hypothetical protein